MSRRSTSDWPYPDNWVVVDGGWHDGISFVDRKLVNFTPIGALFTQCDFRRVDIADMSFGGGQLQSEYRECVFDGAKLRVGPAGRARFVSCSFRDVAIRRMECKTVEFVDCTFSGSIRGGFIKADIPAEVRAELGRDRNEIVGNDFSEVRLTDFYFLKGVDLTRQKLPRSVDYLYLPDGPAAAAAARDVLTACPADLRRFAELVIATVEEITADGQQQIWFRRKELFPKHRDAVAWVLDFWDKSGYATPPP